ncbi:vacuolar membrane sorting protein pep18, putative [Theileria equi strain WA]|uniref:Vacuolar membrane sorting protein pep18, putative n=1 Tax=Theileria equi strain WA TaxID=1537102 RepID=L0AVQ1_THEEQ|nr:vacuolar membrane sorting protein pep18, putative [Theileria equi strain WA]AFZ78959.1 vacuolar membrane sorting protein pep18, putative [Theileria equi strain WA]|eukprot:XP_004828625.1 vacuolar membrane sorting protein pep18, putative [Theileria equi strain WA]
MPIKISVEIKPIRGIPRRTITTLAMANNSLWFGLTNGNVLKFSHEDEYASDVSPRIGDVSSDYAILKTQKSGGSEVRHIYVDSKSFHCLICLASGDNWYANFQSDEMYFLRKLQSVFIRSLAFTDSTDVDSTGPFLIGSQHGSLIEGNIDHKNKQFFFKTLHVLSDGEPVLSIELVPIFFRGARSFLIIATTTKRLYEFFGGFTFEETFSKYSSSTGLRYEVPLAAPYGELLTTEKDDGSHNVFWINATGILFSTIPRIINDDAVSCLAFPPTIIAYPTGFKSLIFSNSNKKIQKHHDNKNSFLSKPAEYMPKNSVALNNHLFLLFDEIILVINIIIGQQVALFPLPYSTYGEMKRIVKDPISGILCILSSDGIYEVVVQNESDDSWHHYMLKGDIKNAMLCCKTSAQRDKVSFKAAHDYFERGMYKEAAKMYANVENSFPEIEAVYLKFINLNQELALIEYITGKIQTMNITKEYPRFIILTIWVVELISYKLRSLSLMMQSGPINKGLRELYETLKLKFSRLLLSIKDIYELRAPINFILHTMGCDDECIEYAKVRNDTFTVICYHISSENYTGALSELSQMPPDEKRDSLFLRFAPIIFIGASDAFSNATFNSLSPNLLVPILSLSVVLDNPIYLEHSLSILKRILLTHPIPLDKSCKSVLWSLFIILLSNLPDEKPLLEVLLDDICFSNYDLSISLRYLRKKSLDSDSIWKVPFIHLLSLCGIINDALDLALEQGNIQLAQMCAMKPVDDFDKRKLWLRILEHSSKSDTLSISPILEQSKGFIKITDVLEYLPDDSRVGDLKDVVNNFLTKFEDNMQEKRQEIAYLCGCIEETKADIQYISKRCVKISPNQICTVCGNVVFLRDFIVFPCEHTFHRGCIAKTLYGLLGGADLIEFKAIKKRFDETQDEKTEAEYNDYLSKACLLCGYPILLLASQPFIFDNDSEEIEKWAIN